MSCTSRPADAIQPGGPDTPETGITLRWSSSTRSGIRSRSKRRHQHWIKRLGAHESGDNCLDTHRVHAEDDSDHAARLVQRTALAEGIAAKDSKPVLHGDNGATLKATTVLAMLHWLGVKPSYSRPRVSDDNAFVEAVFRTAKYRPEYPKSGFADLSDARAWAARFVHWYNLEHRHSGIRYVTPAQRHSGQDVEILNCRDELYQQARQRHPARWARHT